MRLSIWAGVAISLFATAASAWPFSPAQSTLGYTYFNRPGADMTAHNADVGACVDQAQRTRSWDETHAQRGLAGLLAANAGHNAVEAAAIENCMIVKGWRVVRIPAAETETWERLSQADAAARLTPMVGAAFPRGEVVRVWGNEAGNAANQRFMQSPTRTVNGQLSVRAWGKFPEFKDSPDGPTGMPPADTRKFMRQLRRPDQIDTLSPGSSIALFRLKGDSLRNGLQLLFERLPSGSDEGKGDVAWVGTAKFGSSRQYAFVAVTLPPGRWRLASMNIFEQELNFCLGAPSFEVRPGEVLYGGAFDLSAADITPDLSVEPAKAWFAGRPEADKLRAVEYRNGSTGICSGSAIYALEFKNVPFVPGYLGGSAYKAVGQSPH
jgi:hypothetical protein